MYSYTPALVSKDAGSSCCYLALTDGVCYAGEAGAAHLLVSVRDFPVQQQERARGARRTREHLHCLVSASASKQSLPQHPLFTTLGDGTASVTLSYWFHCMLVVYYYVGFAQ